MPALLAGGAAALLAAAGVTITTPLPGNKDAKGAACQSWWCPQLLETKHSTLLFGCCKSGDGKSVTGQMTRSTDAGKSWTKPVLSDRAGTGVYSSTTDTIVMLIGWPPANTSSSSAAPALAAAAGAERAEGGQECPYYLEKYCKADAGKGATCLSCLKSPSHAVLKRGLWCANHVLFAFPWHSTSSAGDP